MHWGDRGWGLAGLDLGHEFQEIVMDLNLIAGAQHLPTNQNVFDQDALDKRISRSEERRTKLKHMATNGLAHLRFALRATSKFFVKWFRMPAQGMMAPRS